jgi:glycosyltransferase involved in cell wall biosynthesis
MQVTVVVPAHNEEELVERCVASLRDAAGHPRLARTDVSIVVVADACCDLTAERAHAAGADVIEVVRNNVGGARAAGMRWALERARGVDRGAVWLASTDADSVVPRHWLASQLAWRNRGAEAVAGTVAVVDWSEQSLVARRRFADHQRALGLGDGHGHVHGANLALTADAYEAVGGMPERELSEDHALWDALHRAGRRVVKAGGLEVITSARREGRASGGFSDLLRHLGAPRRDPAVDGRRPGRARS